MTWPIVIKCVHLLSLVGLCFGVASPHQAAEEDPSKEELRAAPQELEVADRKLQLKTHLWRDFMPGTPAGGSPLMASITLKTVDRQALPGGVKVKKVWLFRGEEVWSTSALEVRRQNDDPSALEIVVRDGPKWETGAHADVVMQFATPQRQRMLLQAKDQEIHRTD